MTDPPFSAQMHNIDIGLAQRNRRGRHTNTNTSNARCTLTPRQNSDVWASSFIGASGRADYWVILRPTHIAFPQAPLPLGTVPGTSQVPTSRTGPKAYDRKQTQLGEHETNIHSTRVFTRHFVGPNVLTLQPLASTHRNAQSCPITPINAFSISQSCISVISQSSNKKPSSISQSHVSQSPTPLNHA